MKALSLGIAAACIVTFASVQSASAARPEGKTGGASFVDSFMSQSIEAQRSEFPRLSPVMKSLIAEASQPSYVRQVEWDQAGNIVEVGPKTSLMALPPSEYAGARGSDPAQASPPKANASASWTSMDNDFGECVYDRKDRRLMCFSFHLHWNYTKTKVEWEWNSEPNGQPYAVLWHWRGKTLNTHQAFKDGTIIGYQGGYFSWADDLYPGTAGIMEWRPTLQTTLAPSACAMSIDTENLVY